jgi:hypothetical protein
MSANDNDKSKQIAGPVIITVHGTFAGNLRENPPHWRPRFASSAACCAEPPPFPPD